MLRIKINFNDNTGSFAIKTIAEAMEGDWDSRSSTNTSGIVTGIEDNERDFATEILEDDNNVESYTITSYTE